jgi:bacillithiol system protein YtxJ
MIDNIQLLDAIDEQSSKPDVSAVVIFKHSIRCIISKMVWGDFEREWKLNESSYPVYFLDLINNRSISNAIAERYGVEHQSPQVLYIKHGKCIHHASHSDISADFIPSGVV